MMRVRFLRYASMFFSVTLFSLVFSACERHAASKTVLGYEEQKNKMHHGDVIQEEASRDQPSFFNRKAEEK